MFSAKWTQFRGTDSAQRILQQIRARAIDRGLVSRVADDASFKMLALWSVRRWESKLGLAALERSGVDRFALIRALDLALQEGELRSLANGEVFLQQVKRIARQFRLRSLTIVVALLAVDSALLLRAPMPCAFAALTATVMIIVYFVGRAIVPCGNDGRGKTLY